MKLKEFFRHYAVGTSDSRVTMRIYYENTGKVEYFNLTNYELVHFCDKFSPYESHWAAKVESFKVENTTNQPTLRVYVTQ